MKVGILTQWYEPEPGPASLPGQLARALARRGHQVQVVTGFPNYPTGKIIEGYRLSRVLDESLEGVRVRRVALYPNHGVSATGRALNYSSFAVSAAVSGISVLRGVDVLWVNYSPVTVGLPLFVHKFFHHTPTLVHVLDLWPDTLSASNFAYTGSAAGRLVMAGLGRWCQRIYATADCVAYISPGVGDVLAQRGVPRSKLVYAPMWANEELVRSVPQEVERPYGLAYEQVALVYAGTLGRAQGLDALIHACAANRDLGVRCLIAGSGTEETRLRSMADEVGATNVTFLGRLSQAEAAALLACGDLHFISLNDEPLARITMPSKVQATLASGRTILAAAVGDLAEVVNQSGGWVVPPGDPTVLARVMRAAVLEGRQSLARRGALARAHYEQEFRLSMGVSRIEDLLERVAEGKA